MFYCLIWTWHIKTFVSNHFVLRYLVSRTNLNTTRYRRRKSSHSTQKKVLREICFRSQLKGNNLGSHKVMLSLIWYQNWVHKLCWVTQKKVFGDSWNIFLTFSKAFYYWRQTLHWPIFLFWRPSVNFSTWFHVTFHETLPENLN